MLDFSKYGDASRALKFFEEISKIPHGSGNTDKIAEYLMSFATSRGLYVRRDGANNVIIKKGATEGFEGRPTVILQGHTDMVEAKKSDKTKDMTTEGLDLYIDGDLLRADGTTLGGDDGVAVAYALALLDSTDIPHPAIEAIFTSDEEIGLLGAVALDTYDIEGRVMINIDSDEEGIFTVGCAGGVRVDLNVPMRVKKTVKNATKISVSGLKGGHSGVEIHKKRENAIKILGEVLAALSEKGRICLGYIEGGNADNAIPRSAEAAVSGYAAEAALLEEIASKYRVREPDIKIEANEITEEVSLFSEEDSARLVSLICAEPSGVIAFSEDIAGLVETSLNLGIIKSSDTGTELAFSIRSSKGVKKEELLTRVTKIAEEHGATHSCHGAYPAWEYRPESHLCEVMCGVYEECYGKSATVVTIHAGLECGIFCDKLDGLDCVSIGPDNYDIHTTEERLSLPSFARVWEFIKKVLKSI